MLIAQLSDSHLLADPNACYRGVQVQARFEAVLARIAERRPDLIVVSGDISDDGSRASYLRAAQLLDQTGCRWVWVPGNHDLPAVMAAIRDFEPLVQAGGWQLLLFNTWREGQEGGRLGTEQLECLTRQLEGDQSPALVVLHHPPVSVGSAWMDEIGLEDSQAFWHAVDGFDQVRGVLCGHVHHDFVCQRGGVSVMGLPAVATQFVPGSDDFATDENAPFGFRLLYTEPAAAGKRPVFLSRIEYL